MKTLKSLSTKIFPITNGLILSIIGFTMLYPFISCLALSFNDGVDAARGGIYFFPRVFTLENYAKAFKYPTIFNAFKISIIITVLGTVISLILNSLAAYAMTFKKMPGRSAIIMFMYFSTLFSGGTIPTYILYKELHLLNSIWIYIIPAIYSFYNMVVLRTFFNGIPESLSEAARIDGCSELRIFARIILPLSMPVLATIALFEGVGLWNDWYKGAFYVTNADLKPAATVLQEILTESSASAYSQAAEGVAGIEDMQKSASNVTPQSLQYTFVIIITLPIIMVYPFLQKYFVKGIMVGAVKD